MEDQEFLELFQQSTVLLREQTLQQLLAENQTYHLLQQKEHSGLLYADHAYLAGIKNMLQLYRVLHL